MQMNSSQRNCRHHQRYLQLLLKCQEIRSITLVIWMCNSEHWILVQTIHSMRCQKNSMQVGQSINSNNNSWCNHSKMLRTSMQRRRTYNSNTERVALFKGE